jgi:hypothetical protein
LIAPPSAASAAKASAMSAEARSFPADFLPAKSTRRGDGPVSIELAPLGAFGRKVRVALKKLTLSQYQ